MLKFCGNIYFTLNLFVCLFDLSLCFTKLLKSLFLVVENKTNLKCSNPFCCRIILFWPGTAGHCLVWQSNFSGRPSAERTSKIIYLRKRLSSILLLFEIIEDKQGRKLRYREKKERKNKIYAHFNRFLSLFL